MAKPRRPIHHPKGRRPDDAAIADVRAVLGDQPRRRDLLIEFLHRLQDHHRCLHVRHLRALAEELRLSQAEVYEVATFYAHFDVVRDGESPPPPTTIRVCSGISCALAGGQSLLQTLAKEAGSDVRVVSAPCVGACDKAPLAVVGKRQIGPADAATVTAAAGSGNLDPEVPPFEGFEAYAARGGYRILRDLLAGKRDRDAVVEEILASGLRGLGGAGFAAGRKWQFLRQAPKPRLMAINADEGEPGTFKDRYCLDTDPHRVLEGALIAAWAVEAEAIYLYVRDEYPQTLALLPGEIATLEAAGLTRDVRIHLRRGAGAYVCGEETAMLESIEGKRGLPRNRPPFPAQEGLFGQPTLVSNVETLFWLRDILERGAEWYQSEGRPRLYSVSGRVRRPGVRRAPSTVTARQLVDDHCGGMLEGHVLKAYLPSGASGGILPAALADLPLDFGALDEYGCFVGSAAVVVLSDHDDLRAVVRNLINFFEDESCGQCTPCRVGCEKMAALIERPVWDTRLLTELGDAMRDASICGLGQAAPNPVMSALRFFADDAG